jgi:hypothetical protein
MRSTAVTSRQGGCFVKEKQLGIAPWCHDRALASVERQHAGNPVSGDPTTATELTLVVVQTSPSIPHQGPSGRDSVDLAKRVNTIVQGHAHDAAPFAYDL